MKHSLFLVCRVRNIAVCVSDVFFSAFRSFRIIISFSVSNVGHVIVWFAFWLLLLFSSSLAFALLFLVDHIKKYWCGARSTLRILRILVMPRQPSHTKIDWIFMAVMVAVLRLAVKWCFSLYSRVCRPIGDLRSPISASENAEKHSRKSISISI